MNAEGPSKTEQSVHILFPASPIEGAPVGRTAKPGSLSRRLLENKQNDHNNLLFQKSMEFDEMVNQIIIRNFQLVKKSQFSFFLHLIIFPPANMDEKLFYFTNNASTVAEEQVNYSLFQVQNAGSAQEYLNRFLEIKAELQLKKSKFKRNILCHFESFVRFSADSFEKLIVLLNEEVISVLPEYKFCLLISVIEGHQYAFQIKNMYLEKTAYFSFASIYSEFLYRIFLGAKENYVFFGREFFTRAAQHNREYLGTLHFERKKWEIYKWLWVLRHAPQIDAFEHNKSLKEVVDASYRRFKFVVKTLRDFIEVAGKKSETEAPILVMNLLTSNYTDASLVMHPSYRNIDELLQRLRMVVDKGKYDYKFMHDVDWKRITGDFWKAMQGTSSTEKPTLSTLPNAKNGFALTQDRMHALISQASNPTQDRWNKLKKAAFGMFETTVELHYRLLRDQAPFLLVDNYLELNCCVNPDLNGRVYRALFHFSNERDRFIMAKVFFDILKEKPEKCPVQEVLLTFQQRLRHVPAFANDLHLNDDQVDAFMYCQQLFEHLQMTRLTHKGVYFLEKMFFGKYSRRN